MPRSEAATTPGTDAAGLDTEFTRGLGLYDATMVVVGSMIGSGIFIVSADMARLVGSPGWLLLAWVVTGILTGTAALGYAQSSSTIGAGGSTAGGGSSSTTLGTGGSAAGSGSGSSSSSSMGTGGSSAGKGQSSSSMGTGGSSAGTTGSGSGSGATGLNRADDAAGRHGQQGRDNARQKQDEHKKDK